MILDGFAVTDSIVMELTYPATVPVFSNPSDPH